MVKNFLLCLLLVASSYGWSQTIYTSPYTQFFPSGLIEEVNRKITIGEKEITIISETLEGKDIQSLQIQGVSVNDEGQKEYYCTSKDGLAKTVLVLKKANPPYLDIFQPELDNPSLVQHFRLLLD